MQLLQNTRPPAISGAGRHNVATPAIQGTAGREQRYSRQLQQCSQCSSSGRSSSSLLSARSSRHVVRVAATDSAELDEVIGPQYMVPEVAEVLSYALKLSWAAETYDIHSWMILLGLLKNEQCLASQVLKELGLEDLYGAWHEVLWALNVSDGLEPRAFSHKIMWGYRAYSILQGSLRFATWAGRDKVETQDLLMAFAASDVLSTLFPDVDLSLEKVKHAIEKRTGQQYKLPGFEESALSSQDMFL